MAIMTKLKFMNDVLRPWDELNELLSLQYAFQPDLSAVTRLAGNIAIAIRHQVDFSSLNDKQANNLSHEHQIICDVGDYYKHGSLRNPERNNSIQVLAIFEYDNDQFAFSRNMIEIDHVTYGLYDFMEVTAIAAKFWIEQHSLDIDWPGKIQTISPKKFNYEAVLKFDSKYCIEMESTRIKIFKADSNKKLRPYSPKELRFCII